MSHHTRNGFFSLARFSYLCFPLALAAQTVTPSPAQPVISAGETNTVSVPINETGGLVQPAELSPEDTTIEPLLTPPATTDTEEEIPITSLSSTPSYYGASSGSGTSALGTPSFANLPVQGVDSLLANPLRWGPFTVHPHLDYAFTYGTGVLYRPGADNVAAYHTLSPGLQITSEHLSIDYTPSLLFYTKGRYEDTVNHAANLSAHFGYGDWSFGFHQGYQNSSSALIETATQTETETFSTAIDANWRYTEKIFFNFTISQQYYNPTRTGDLQDTGLQSSWRLSTMEWINYRITEHFSMGAGLGGGYSQAGKGSDSTFEQIQGRLNWYPSARLNVHLNGGVEIRQFLDRQFLDGASNADNIVNPIMSAAISYHLFEPTSLHLNASQTVNNSIFAGQIEETSAISAGVSQRLLGRLHLGVDAGFRTKDFKSTVLVNPNTGTLRPVRTDDSTFVSATISTSFLKKINVSFSYQHSQNESSREGYTYDSDQYTAHLGFRF